MVNYKPLPSPLTKDDLPETDNQLVDNELQVLITYNEQGNRHLTPEDVIEQERQLRAQAE